MTSIAKRVCLVAVLLAPLPAAANTVTVSSGAFSDHYDLAFAACGAGCTFAAFDISSPSRQYAVAGEVDFFDPAGGVITLAASNYSGQDLTYALEFDFGIPSDWYGGAFTSLSGNGTASLHSFVATGSLHFNTGAANNLGVDLGPIVCPVAAASSDICDPLSVDSALPAAVYSHIYGDLTTTLPGGTGLSSTNANQVAWDASFGLEPTPEPRTMFLLAIGLLGVVRFKKR